uniref:Uncharacterized protein n=1 Tax=Rhizophora mucronata TaxID=61149 RepID=A0A2P2PM09_RHIMU
MFLERAVKQYRIPHLYKQKELYMSYSLSNICVIFESAMCVK